MVLLEVKTSPSIVINYKNFLQYNKLTRQLLRTSDLFNYHFSDSKKGFFPHLHKKSNKNYSKLIKLYHTDPTKIQFKPESIKSTPNKQNVSNKIAYFVDKRLVIILLYSQWQGQKGRASKTALSVFGKSKAVHTCSQTNHDQGYCPKY